MIKFELPQDDAVVLKHIGIALQNIAAAINGEVTTNTVDPQNKPVPTEQVVAEIDNVEQQYSTLAADGVVNTVEDDTPPPPVEDVPKSQSVTDVVDQVESAVDHAGDVELDINNLPWDKRIHSANKSKNADNSWRNARQPKAFDGDWKAHIKDVEGELLGAMSATTTEDDTPPPPSDVPDTGGTPFDQAVTQDLPPPPSGDLPPKTFPELMKLVTGNAKEKGSVAKVQAIIAKHEYGSLQTLASVGAEAVTKVYHELEAQL